MEKKWKTEWTKPSKSRPYALTGAQTFVEGTHKKFARPRSWNATKAKKLQKQWVENYDTYEVHRPARVHYSRRLCGPVYGIDDQWQMDLSDMQRDDVKRVNDGYCWILFAIDVFSRKAWAVPLKSKSGPETARGMKQLFDHVAQEGSDHATPHSIYVDRGREFYNKEVKKLLSEYPFAPTLHSGHSTTKAAIVERLQRTIKGQMWKYFYETGSYRWLELLPKLMEAYNARKHGTLKRAPDDVTKDNEEEVFRQMYGDVPRYRDEAARLPEEQKDALLFAFKVGDVVRVSKQAQLFDKKYLPRWSEELFRVRARDAGPPPYYRLVEYRDGGETIEGTFYAPELQKVDPSQIPRFRIESVLERRRDPRTRRNQVFVKYKGWPDTYNEWIDARDVKELS